MPDDIATGLRNDISRAVLFGGPLALNKVLAAPIHRDALLDAMGFDAEQMADSGLYDSYGNPPKDIGELIIRPRVEASDTRRVGCLIPRRPPPHQTTTPHTMPDLLPACWCCPECGHVQNDQPRRNKFGNAYVHFPPGSNPTFDDPCVTELEIATVVPMRPRGAVTDA